MADETSAILKLRVIRKRDEKKERGSLGGGGLHFLNGEPRPDEAVVVEHGWMTGELDELDFSPHRPLRSSFASTLHS